VISFFKKGKLFEGGLPFCISVRNKIYVLGIEMLGPVSMAQAITSFFNPDFYCKFSISVISKILFQKHSIKFQSMSAQSRNSDFINQRKSQ